jgi:hypothetical protein
MTFASDDLELRLGLVDGGEPGDDLPGRGLSHHLLQKRRVVKDGVPHHPQRRGRMMKDLSEYERLLDLAGSVRPGFRS